MNRALALTGTAAGYLSLMAFIWALVRRLEHWDAAPFVALLYLSTAACVGAIIAHRRGRRGPEPTLGSWGRGALIVLALLLTSAHLYLRVGWVRDVVGWVQRHAWAWYLH